MQVRTRALLVHHEEGPLTELKFVLEGQGIETSRVRTCAEAEAALTRAEPPFLIFTDTVLTDGTWANVAALAEKGHPALSVIVVSRQVDIPLYLDVLESSASDFIVPPFRDADVAHVVKGALREAGSDRNDL
jgi:two-component system, chemotaxis family, chemotaxis protein CheY